MVIDVTTYNGEKELFEIRYNILKDYVDQFRVIEFEKTFSGKEKGLTFDYMKPKVQHHYMLEEDWDKYRELALNSPNTQYGKGAKHWVTEFCQKESIKDCLIDLEDNDILFIGDVDEIWMPQAFDLTFPMKLKLKVYTYWLNNRSDEEFWGTVVCRYKDIKSRCLNHFRTGASKTQYKFGWHFTSQGGYGKMKQKLTDSYTNESYATEDVLNNLKDNIKNNKDFLGRNFKYKIDESDWPEYLRKNKEKYTHLCK